MPSAPEVVDSVGSVPAIIDADLAAIIRAWPALPEAIRRAVVAVVGSAPGR